jgi:hypothetical protein
MELNAKLLSKKCINFSFYSTTPGGERERRRENFLRLKSFSMFNAHIILETYYAHFSRLSLSRLHAEIHVGEIAGFFFCCARRDEHED